jgi:hypothetical protein
MRSDEQSKRVKEENKERRRDKIYSDRDDNIDINSIAKPVTRTRQKSPRKSSGHMTPVARIAVVV